MGGILVGDASDYSTYVALTKSDDPLEVTPAELAVGITTPGGAGGAGNDVADMPDAAQVRAVTNYICYFTMSCMSSYHRVGHPPPRSPCFRPALPMHHLFNPSFPTAPYSPSLRNLQICSCNDVTKGTIVQAIKDGTCDSLAAVKSCTKAGTGCAGCVPVVTDLFVQTMASVR